MATRGGVQGGGKHANEFDLLLWQLEPAGFDLSGEQQVGYQPEQSVGIPIDNGEILVLFVGERIILVVGDELQVTQDGTERGAQLVRNEG